MLKTTLTASALIAVLAGAPASAASVGCSGPNLEKAETIVDQMADGPARWAGFHEIAAAQDELLAGHMRGCAGHIVKVLKMAPVKTGL